MSYEIHAWKPLGAGGATLYVEPNPEKRQTFIDAMLSDQANGLAISPENHERLILLVDMGVLGMDGFKYCERERAKQIYEWMLANGWVHPARMSA